MSTQVQPEAIPSPAGYPGGSLEEAQSRILGLLGDTPTQEKETPQPEQRARKPKADTPSAAAAPAEQAPPAPDAEETPAPEPVEAKTEEAEKAEEDDQPRPIYKVKVNGQEVEVTLDEALKGYSRTEDYTRKTQQLADERKRFEESELAAVRAERHQYQTSLDTLKQAIQSVTPEKPNWDVRRLQVTPDVLAAEMLEWNKNQQSLESIRAEQARVKALQDADAQRGFQQYLADQQAKLEAALPEMKDPEKAPVLKSTLTTYAKSLGFTDEDLSTVTDHRLVLVLDKARRFDEAEAKRPVIQQKIENKLTTVAPGNRSPAPKASKLDEAKERLKRSGNLDDAAAAIAHLL